MQETTYDVTGMTCAHCEAAVTEEVLAVAGVHDVDVSHATGRLLVRGDDVDDAEVRAAVVEAGYAVS